MTNAVVSRPPATDIGHAGVGGAGPDAGDPATTWRDPQSTSRVVWFGLTVVLNLAVLAHAVDQGPVASSAVDAALAMFCIGVACRHDRLVKGPFAIGRVIRSYAVHQLTDHLGQLHRATVLAGSMWLAVAVLEAVRAGDAIGRSVGVVVLALLAAMTATARDAVRHHRHEQFEALHRYGGWAALALVGVLVGRDAIASAPDARFLGLLAQPTVGMFAALLALVVEPWLGVRRRPVEIIDVTGDVVILALPGRRSCGQFVRVSRDGREWHSFAVATVGSEALDNFCLVIRRAGDWTERLAHDVERGNRPTHLFVRRARGHGFMYHAQAYAKVLFVATGAGIGPVLPYLIDRQSPEFECLWIGRDHRRSMGDELVRRVLAGGRVTLVDSSNGRPDIAELVSRIAARFDAVFVVSNRPVRDDVARACAGQGVRWYGPTFDS